MVETLVSSIKFFLNKKIPTFFNETVTSPIRPKVGDTLKALLITLS